MPAQREEAVGRTVAVYWAEEDDWFDGIIDDFVDHPDRGYHIQYYDGDEEWLPTLLPSEDRKVRFADGDREYGSEGNNHSNEDPVSDGSVPAESFLGDTKAVEIDDEVLKVEADPIEEDVGADYHKTVHFDDTEELAVIHDTVTTDSFPNFDVNLHRDLNVNEMCSQLDMLPPRSLLLVGSVLGLEDAPAHLMTDGVTFKVLFVEGGDQPAMFRCKTPVFTSGQAIQYPGSDILAWEKDGGRFRFDMTMPEETTEKQYSSTSMRQFGFCIQGEVMVSIYQAKRGGGGGGNTMVGQVAFNLADMITVGTVEPFLQGFEGRSISGAHEVKLRNGGCIQMELQLFIGWRSLFPASEASKDDAVVKDIAGITVDGRVTPQRSVSANAIRRKSANASSSIGNVSKKKLQASVTQKSKAEVPRKIVSKFQLQQSADRKRLEAENRKMKQKLAAAGPTKVKKNNAGASTVPREEMILKGKVSNTTLPTVAVAAENDVQALAQLLHDLHKENSSIVEKNKKLHGKLNMIKTNVRYCENSTEKLESKRSVCGSCDRPSNSFMKSTGSRSALPYRSMTVSGGETEMKSEFMRNIRDNDSGQCNNEENEHQRHLLPASNTGAPKATSAIGPLTEEEIEEHKIQIDSEYKNLAEEFMVLQSVRRGLLERIDAANESCAKASKFAASVKDKEDLLQKRLSYYEDVAGDAVWLTPERQITPLSGTGASAASGLHGHGRLPRSRYPMTKEDGDDREIFNDLRQAKLNLARESAQLTEELHTAALDNALEEQRAVLRFLHDECSLLEKDVKVIDGLQRAEQRQLAALVKSNIAHRTRSSITHMRALCLKEQRRVRISHIRTGQQTIEMELLRLRMQRKEKDVGSHELPIHD